MMFMPGPFELLILLLMVGLPLFVVVRLVMGSSRTGPSEERKSQRAGFSLGHATLTCPHCQQETTAGKPQCENCGEDL